jgi:hypothetical protein
MKSISSYKLVVAVLIAGLFLLIIPISVSANPGLSVSNDAINVSVSPGQTLTETMGVSIGSADPATGISVQVGGLAQSPSGAYQFLDAAQDISQYSARSFISIDNSSFELQPGGSQNVTATIQVPQDVGNGGRYALIDITTQPAAGTTGIGILTQVEVPVYLTITGSQITQTGKITGLTTSTITSGQPIDITTDFENTGNHHYKVEDQVTVKNAKSKILDTMSIPLTTSSILPGMTRQLETTLNTTSSLAVGTYTIDSKVMLDGGTLLDETTSTFVVTAEYMPPAPSTTSTVANQPLTATSANLSPSTATTLQSSDGTISVVFPQGAAVVPVEVSLQSYSNQLPALPVGLAAASSYFQVSGLTGLLAKNATVTVKYSADELSKANGNASSLKLLRFDSATNQWIVLTTKANTTAMTINASSDQMGVWAVTVSSTASSGINWIMIGIIIAAVIIIAAIVTIFLLTRRRPKEKPAKKIIG